MTLVNRVEKAGVGQRRVEPKPVELRRHVVVMADLVCRDRAVLGGGSHSAHWKALLSWEPGFNAGSTLDGRVGAVGGRPSTYMERLFDRRHHRAALVLDGDQKHELVLPDLVNLRL